MLFEQSREKFSDLSFQNPGACYRGAPFWSWNTLITKDMIDRQISEFKKMGMGGFHVHVRVGLKNQYLSDEFMELVRYCNEKARENGMLCWLYDEDRYSSGIAGGEVTKNVFFRARWLKLSVRRDEEMLESQGEFLERQKRNEKVRGCFLRAYDIVLESGYLKKASIVEKDAEAEGTKWYLYVELAEESPWCNNQTFVDTLKPEAIAAFIHITHEKYAKILQEDFGKSVPAIFTDEPHINGLKLPGNTEDIQDIRLPYTESLPEIFGKAGGMDFFEAIPYIIWNCGSAESYPQRYHYYHTLSCMFTDAYCRQIGDWCEAHGLMSTGHLLGEDSLGGQSSNTGEAMRCYREFQLPGIDNLCDNRDFVAAKQVSSIVHQYKKEGAMSEMYGVTQWDFDFEGYKLAGDWQAALGINVRVPHLAWASMNGEAKRDYPAAIGWQSPWYEEFSYIENHFARVNYCLTRGKAVIHIGVLHPVESFWILNGPGNQSEGRKKQLSDDFENLTKWLLTGGIDFDYIAESSLADETALPEGGILCCRDMTYEAVIVPSCVTIRETTLEKLLRFSESGGTVYFVGETPEYVDCQKSGKLVRLINNSERIGMSRQAVLEKLSRWREVDLWERGGKRTWNLLHQLREEEDCRWLFIAQAYKGMEGRQEEIWYRRALHAPQQVNIQVKGCWKAEKYDTLTGKKSHMDGQFQKGWTVFPCDLFGDDSLLIRLEAVPDGLCRQSESGGQIRVHGRQEEVRSSLPEPDGYRMSEPNVLILDRFEYALDDGAYQEACEMLKLDNRIREQLNLPLRCEALAQPYIRLREDRKEHTVYLRTCIYSEVEISDCFLALEEAENSTCVLNGQTVDMKPAGYYVDPAITKIKLPKIRKGNNELYVTVRYGDGTNLEWMYLLGDFGVELKGAHAFLKKKPERLFWGDYTRQGFPFYTGNMTYLVKLPPEQTENEEKQLQIAYYAGAAVKAKVNDGKQQHLTFLPRKYTMRDLKKDDNILEITCFGNRYNGFGQLHLIGDDMYWLGPDSWRSEGTSWTDTYQVRPMGILAAPQIITENIE